MAHNSNDLKRILNLAQQSGCKIEHGKKNSIKIIPADKNIPMYIAHDSNTAYHPIRRYLKNKLGIE